MTEPDSIPPSGAESVSSQASEKATAGGLLRAAREAQGLHIAALATAIKVTPRKVDALEGNRLHELPDATFARALAQTICRHLKIDPQPVMALLPPSGHVVLEPASRIRSTPYRDRAGAADPALGKSLGPLLWAAALLLVGAAVVYLLPSGWLGTKSDAVVLAPTGAVAAAVPSVLPAASAASAAVVGTPESAAAAAAGTASPAASAANLAASAALPAAQPGADRSPSLETVFAAPPSSAGSAPAVSGALVVTTTDASWVEVRDAKGQLLLSETVQPGRSVGLDGPLPMRLLVGNAAATQLVFMGRPVDVMSRARENVARFELQ